MSASTISECEIASLIRRVKTLAVPHKSNAKKVMLQFASRILVFVTWWKIVMVLRTSN
jgi:hypothetical protein